MKRGTKKIVVAGSGAVDVGRKIARKAQVDFSKLDIGEMPDGELRVRFKRDIKGDEVFLVQSFYPDANDKIVETLLAGYTARKYTPKITLIALFFPYLREDKEFEKGEAVSARIMGQLFKVFDKVYICEPHLHRYKSLREFFPNATRIWLVDDIAEFIRKKIKNPLIVGPDEESEQWARKVADKLGASHAVLKKKRFSPHSVKILSKLGKVKEENIVIVDDIISTGGTILEAIKSLNVKGKKISVIAFHGLFCGDSLSKLNKKAGVFTTNTIKSPASKIDISGSIAKVIRGW